MTAEPTSFGDHQFGRLDLGHVKRTRRLVELADLLQRHPGGTLPDKLNRPADLRAFYRLMDRPEVTHQALMAGHVERTRQRIAECVGSVVLILHDATELDYTTRTTVCSQLSQIGEGSHKGFICHNSLAIRADDGSVLGLTSQILHLRAVVARGETAKQKRERADRESRLWPRGAQASGAAPAGVRCVDVSDSLSDTFEYMASELATGRLFLLRAREDRRLDDGEDEEEEATASATASADAEEEPPSYLYETIRAVAPQAERTLVVQPTSGRTGRTTTVKIAFAPVRLAVPGKRLGEYANRALDLWAVRIWEENPPAGEAPLEWILLTNVAVKTAADALERLDWYERRWVVEEYHKAMKTGCRIESMQFDTAARLEPAIAVLSAVATTLLELRDAARSPEADTRPASTIIDRLYIEVLRQHYGSRLGAEPSVLRFYLHVARLGGHQNRKVDGLPGWLTLWRGWTKLNLMVDGYLAAQRKATKSCGTN
jgi:hypothetical protein